MAARRDGERFFTSRLIQDPYPHYDRLRAERPAHYDPATRELLLTRYADVAGVLRSPSFSSRQLVDCSLPIPAFARWPMRPILRIMARQMLFSDPPDHTRLRSLANKAFTPRVVEAMRGRIRETAEGLLDAAGEGARVDAIGQYAARLPVLVIGEMLGTPPEHFARFKSWSDDLALFIGGTTRPLPEVLLRAARGLFGLHGYFRKLVRRRRSCPAEDLLGALIAAEEQGDALTEEELLANCVLLLAAGHETTTNLIGNGLHTLLRHPEQLALLRREPALMENAVEEILRYDSPVQWAGRVAREEFEVAGRRVLPGQTVALGLAAANRDPAQFPDPDRLDLRRPDIRHLAFGHGIHFCLGAALARLEGQVALEAILDRFPRLRLEDAPVEWHPNFTLRGLKRLPLLLH